MKSIQEIFANAKKLDPKVAKVKSESISEMLKMLEGIMGQDLKGLKKVTIASDTEEGLKEGVEKAEEILEAKEGKEGESCEMEDSEMPKSEKESEYSEDSEESKMAKIEKELEEIKAKKKGEEVSKPNLKSIF